MADGGSDARISGACAAAGAAGRGRVPVGPRARERRRRARRPGRVQRRRVAAGHGHDSGRARHRRQARRRRARRHPDRHALPARRRWRRAALPLDALRDQRVEASEVDRAFDLAGDLAPADVIAASWRPSPAAGRTSSSREAARRLGAADVRTVARELSISDRQLRRRFHTAVGYGPKTLERVLRFRRFVNAIDDGRADLAALAFDVGYADQAHLTREATRLAGAAAGGVRCATGRPFRSRPDGAVRR